MLLVSFPRSNQNVRALLQGLARHELLHSFHTTLHFEPGDLLVKLAPPGLRRELLKRSFGIAHDKCRTYPGLEFMRLLARRSGMSNKLERSDAWASTDHTSRNLDQSVANYLKRLGSRAADHLSAVYGYEDSSLETFEQARQLGLHSYYELTIPYFETVHSIVQREAALRPEWTCTMQTLHETQNKLETKRQELERADTIICISEFVRDSLPPDVIRRKKIEVVRYGAPNYCASPSEPKPRNDRLKVLFVGALTQQKGLADLFDAYNMLKRKDIELIVLGTPLAPMEFYYERCPDFTYIKPCPHKEVLELMTKCDVLVFPSLYEGRGMVQLEAMSCGLPIISTPNATGLEIVENGKTGFVVEIDSPQQIAEKLDWFADNREQTKEMGIAAQQEMLKWTWESYVDQVMGIVRQREA